jgi:chromate reductase
MTKFKVAVVVGSIRQDSINRKLAQAIARLGASQIDFTFVPIGDLPLYNSDLEADLPASVSAFKAAIEAADGVLFLTPEHNRSIPAALKNAIDWGARPYGKTSWPGKPAAITGTSPGAISSAIAQQHLRTILGDLGMLVMGGEAYINFKPGLIDEDNAVTDEAVRKFLQAFTDQFAGLVAKFVPVQSAVKAA